jgi:Glu-tRNA(Gln) amidotransferase subunit E-like FAD-binding protein
MYPDTDLPPKQVTAERLETIRRRLPVPIWTRESWYRQIGVPTDVVEPLAASRLAGLFEVLVKDWKISPIAASVALVQFRKRLKKKGLDVGRLDEDSLRRIFAFFRDRKISRDGVLAFMETAARGQALPQVGEVRPASEVEVYARVQASSAALRGMKIHNPEKKPHALMGLVMPALRGRVEGAAVVERVRAAAEEKC